MFDLYNIVGFIGTALYFTSYFMFNAGKFDGRAAQYIIMNMMAALCVMFSLLEHFNAPSMTIQTGWVGLSLYGLYRLRQKSRQAAGVVEQGAP